MADTPVDLTPRVAVLEEAAANAKANFDRIDRRLETIDARIAAMAAEHHTDLIRLPIMMFGGWASLLGVMAKGFKWF
jgi:hypothetical protein